MRHRIAGFKLGRDTEHRRALRRNLAVALFTHGQITTTIPKAKSVKPFVEKIDYCGAQRRLGVTTSGDCSITGPYSGQKRRR